MKRSLSVLLCLAALLCLTACRGEEASAPTAYEPSVVQSLAEAGAFSEELEPLDADTAFALYQLESCGLHREDLADCAVLRSTGATCEEAALLVIGGEDPALPEQARQGLEAYVQSQIDANTDYRPAEIPKLENALIDCRGRHVLLVVANDPQAAKDALGWQN